jgi:uncharacterized SAM-binding protein YcdF (DUF218 family)
MGNFLIINEMPQKSDVIIILAGDYGERVAYGGKLYLSGYADKVLLSGNDSGMKQQALSQGIPESAILLEDQSRTTFENAKYSFKIVQAQGFKSVIVVTSPYHTRRASIIFTQFFRGIFLTICPVPYNPAMTRNWGKDGYSTQFVVSEYLKLVWHYLLEWH